MAEPAIDSNDDPCDEGSEGRLRWMAMLTVAAAMSPFLLTLAESPALLAQPRYLLWLALATTFGALLWLPRQDRRRGLAYLLAHSALALGLVTLLPNALYAVFLVVVAVEVGSSRRASYAYLWVAAQTFLLAWILVRARGWQDGLVMAGAFAGFQLFAVYAAHAAASERRARLELAAVNAELRATRSRLAESSRTAERLRIARDLHDVMGHHLTALSLNLETARHAAPETATAHTETAHRLTRRLLAELRRVVGRLREPEAPAPGFGEALAALSDGIERPRLHLRIGVTPRELENPEHAAALLRCAQETLTNAVRHSGAENLWIELQPHEGGLQLTARDDGGGAAESDLASSHGLRGMRERLERLGGKLTVEPALGSGFQVTAWLPTS